MSYEQTDKQQGEFLEIETLFEGTEGLTKSGIKVRVVEANGRRGVDIRKFVVDVKQGFFGPTRKGIFLQLDIAREVLKALRTFVETEGEARSTP